jgi:hypothetical protein
LEVENAKQDAIKNQKNKVKKIKEELVKKVDNK